MKCSKELFLHCFNEEEQKNLKTEERKKEVSFLYEENSRKKKLSIYLEEEIVGIFMEVCDKEKKSKITFKIYPENILINYKGREDSFSMEYSNGFASTSYLVLMNEKECFSLYYPYVNENSIFYQDYQEYKKIVCDRLNRPEIRERVESLLKELNQQFIGVKEIVENIPCYQKWTDGSYEKRRIRQRKIG